MSTPKKETYSVMDTGNSNTDDSKTNVGGTSPVSGYKIGGGGENQGRVILIALVIAGVIGYFWFTAQAEKAVDKATETFNQVTENADDSVDDLFEFFEDEEDAAPTDESPFNDDKIAVPSSSIPDEFEIDPFDDEDPFNENPFFNSTTTFDTNYMLNGEPASIEEFMQQKEIIIRQLEMIGGMEDQIRQVEEAFAQYEEYYGQ